jgi:uncharacterized damage-inducible protein DinB
MITPQYVRGFSAYNAEMNRRVYGAAARLSDEERKLDRGAFFGSIHGTLNHLMWGDTMWMSRFDGWPKPEKPIGDSAQLFDDFDAMWARRQEMDRGIEAWAADVTAEWLAGQLTWYSGLAGREISAPRTLILMHFFNHQTHHRGQAHAILTGLCGRAPELDLLMFQRVAGIGGMRQVG